MRDDLSLSFIVAASVSVAGDDGCRWLVTVQVRQGLNAALQVH